MSLYRKDVQGTKTGVKGDIAVVLGNRSDDGRARWSRRKEKGVLRLVVDERHKEVDDNRTPRELETGIRKQYTSGSRWKREEAVDDKTSKEVNNGRR